MLTTNAVLVEFQAFLLIFLRSLSIVGLVPILGGRTIPSTVKIGLAAVVAYIMTPLIYLEPASIPTNMLAYGFLAVKEVMVGLTIGFTATMLFMGVQATGEMLGMQMGLSMGQVIDPQSQRQVSLVGQLEYTVAILIFLAWDGHHFFIKALNRSFEVIPLTQYQFQKLPVEHIIRLMIDIIISGVRIASPVIITLLLSTILFALVARVVPRMNVFILSFPVSIGVGLLTLGFSLESASKVFEATYISFQVSIMSIIDFMGG